MTSHLSDADRAELNHVWSELAAAQRIIERLLGDDDPMLYDRSDDDEPAAPTRPHYGWTLTGRNQRPTNSPTGPASDTRRDAHLGLGPVGGKQGEARTRGLASPAYLRVGVA